VNEGQYNLTQQMEALLEEKRRLIAANPRPPMNSNLPGDRSQRLAEVERLITEVSNRLTSQFPKARA
jgi:hypothetical protein